MYRVKRSKITRASGERYQPGDMIEPTEAELTAFGDNLEMVESEGESSDDESTMFVDSDNSENTETDICGAIMSNGEECDRPVDECSYHDKS